MDFPSTEGTEDMAHYGTEQADQWMNSSTAADMSENNEHVISIDSSQLDLQQLIGSGAAVQVSSGNTVNDQNTFIVTDANQQSYLISGEQLVQAGLADNSTLQQIMANSNSPGSAKTSAERLQMEIDAKKALAEEEFLNKVQAAVDKMKSIENLGEKLTIESGAGGDVKKIISPVSAGKFGLRLTSLSSTVTTNHSPTKTRAKVIQLDDIESDLPPIQSELKGSVYDFGQDSDSQDKGAKQKANVAKKRTRPREEPTPPPPIPGSQRRVSKGLAGPKTPAATNAAAAIAKPTSASRRRKLESEDDDYTPVVEARPKRTRVGRAIDKLREYDSLFASLDEAPVVAKPSSASKEPPKARETKSPQKPKVASRRVYDDDDVTSYTVPGSDGTRKNKSVLCKPVMQSKVTMCRPLNGLKETQTDSKITGQGDRVITIPIPIPFYIPVPCCMYTQLTPIPLAIPVPVPVPIFLPVQKLCMENIAEAIKEMTDRTPSDPREADLLKMAEAAAESASNSEKPGEASSTTNSNLTTSQGVSDQWKGTAPPMAAAVAVEKKSKPENTVIELEPLQDVEALFEAESGILNETTNNANTPATKASFGLNAFHHWVVQRNSQLETGGEGEGEANGGKRLSLNLLKYTTDELSEAMSLFVQEVRRPNGEQYLPENVFFLCLGIQQYLIKNGRKENIFLDDAYGSLSNALEQIVTNYQIRVTPDGKIFSRIEEDIFWECEQFGANSPMVLLNTLLFFSTKCFLLDSIEKQTSLGFSHIVKLWKRPAGFATGNRRDVVLRYAPAKVNEPLAVYRDFVEQGAEGVLEINQSYGNPMRCPVKLFEFYVSRCPESVRTRADIFYLAPEKRCQPDSPVWFTSQPLGADVIQQMLNRILLIKEVNSARYTIQITQGDSYQ